MEEKDFLESVLNDVNDRLPAGRVARYTKVDKNNDTVYTGLYVSAERDHTVSPLVYMEPLYERFAKHEATYEEIVERVTAILMVNKIPEEDLKGFVKEPYVRSHLVYRLYGTKRNAKKREALVTRDFLNMFYAYAVYVEDDRVGVGLIPFTKSMAEEFSISPEECFELAEKNTASILPINRIDLSDSSGPADDAERAQSFLVITNAQSFFGAPAVFYKGVLEETAKRFGDDLYLLPTSVHEMIVVPASVRDPGELSSIFLSILKNETKPDDVLTDTIYRYDRTSKEVSVVSESGPEKRKRG